MQVAAEKVDSDERIQRTDYATYLSAMELMGIKIETRDDAMT